MVAFNKWGDAILGWRRTFAAELYPIPEVVWTRFEAVALVSTQAIGDQ
jgi:hypothetical protein